MNVQISLFFATFVALFFNYKKMQLRFTLLPTILVALFVFSAFVACTPDRTDLIPKPITVVPTVPIIDTLPLTLNELVATGSTQTNEYGSAEDWVELYNTSAQPLIIRANTWYVSDDSTKADKYLLPPMTIPAKGFVTVWCDLLDIVNSGNIHTNFKLSSTGEFIGIGYKQGSTTRWIDKHPFGQQSAGTSEGKKPDGVGAWQQLSPSFGSSNN
jgi:hypothetical protein